MALSKRAFCASASAVLCSLAAPLPAWGAHDPVVAALRRLGAVARQTLPPSDIAELIAVDGPRLTARPPAGETLAQALAREARADFRRGRTIELAGVRFARIEVARFLTA